MTIFSNMSVSFRLKIPIIMQGLLLLVVAFFYFSSDQAVRSRQEQTREMGEMVGSLSSVTTDIQRFLRGQGEFKKVDADLRTQISRVDKLPVGSDIAHGLKQMATVLQDSAKLFQRNTEIEKEVFTLTGVSITQSDRYITETTTKLADPKQEASVSRLMRMVIAGASVNSGTNHNIQALFLKMKMDTGRGKELLALLDTSISNVATDVQRLAGTPFAELPQKAMEANKRIRELTLEYLANNDKLAVAGKEIEKQNALIRTMLDQYAAKSMVAGYDFFKSRMAVLLLIIIVASGVMAVLNWSLSRGILRPMNDMATALQKITQGELTVRLPITSNDEIGKVCQLFNSFVEKMHDIISRMARTADQVAAASSQLHNTAEQIATGAEEVASQTGTVATASEEMAATSSDIARNCHAAADSAGVAVCATQSGFAIVKHTVDGIRIRGQHTKENAAVISKLGERSEQIGAIVGTIEDIADQTNLLALNAAIEAARAGEMGRGFAVVADEVRALAERTTRATKEISDMIRAIQQETNVAITSMEDGVKGMEQGAAEAEQLETSLHQILEQVNDVTMQVSQIATAAEQQTATTGEVTTNIQQITDVVQQTAKGADDTAAAAAQLAGQAQELQGLVGRFRL